MSTESDGTSSQSCYHCGLPVPGQADYRVAILGQERRMCCSGCQAVAQAIVDGGMEDYYRYRTEEAVRPENSAPDFLDQILLYDNPAVQKSFVAVDSNNVRHAALMMEGIQCAACVWLSEKHVKALPGILSFSVNYSTNRAQVSWDESLVHLSDILRAIHDIGYQAHPFDPNRMEEAYKRERSQMLRRLAVAGLGMMQVMMVSVGLYIGEEKGTGMDAGMLQFLRWMALVMTLPVVLYSALGFFVTAWRDIKARRLGMDVPVSIAVILAFSLSVVATVHGSGDVYFDSVTMFTFFLLSGRYLEMMARHKSGEAADSLVKIMPASARRKQGDGFTMVAVGDLELDDILLVRAGEIIPADGVVIEGVSGVDESLMTGESVPVTRREGDPVIAGGVNRDSALMVRVEKVGADTVLAGIVRLLDRAQAEKPSLARIADHIAGRFVAAILLIALVVGLYWWWKDPGQAVWITLAVLVVTCPCALSLATPAALTAGTGSMTRAGLLITRGHALETFAQVTDIVFDKTGTLTQGHLVARLVWRDDSIDATECLRMAASLEQYSEHPIARAIEHLYEGDKTALAFHEVVAGSGVLARLEDQEWRIGSCRFAEEAGADCGDVAEGSVFLVCGAKLMAAFAIEDELRADAGEMVQLFRSSGIRAHLLSGDNVQTVAHVGDVLGIENAHGALRPDEKLSYVKELQRQGAIVAMVGDGVNDAPVLAGAQLSIAMGEGSQLAQAASDMVLLSDRLVVLHFGWQMARRTTAVIRQNIGWAILYNALAVPLAAMGMVAPWMAAIGMSASSLLVVINALRLRS